MPTNRNSARPRPARSNGCLTESRSAALMVSAFIVSARSVSLVGGQIKLDRDIIPISVRIANGIREITKPPKIGRFDSGTISRRLSVRIGYHGIRRTSLFVRLDLGTIRNMSKTQKPADLISTSDAAEILGVTDSLVRRWGREGKLRVVEFGPRAKLLHRADVVALSKQDRKPGPKPAANVRKRRAK